MNICFYICVHINTNTTVKVLGESKVICRFFTVGGVGTHSRHVIQGSTIYMYIGLKVYNNYVF